MTHPALAASYWVQAPRYKQTRCDLLPAHVVHILCCRAHRAHSWKTVVTCLRVADAVAWKARPSQASRLLVRWLVPGLWLPDPAIGYSWWLLLQVIGKWDPCAFIELLWLYILGWSQTPYFNGPVLIRTHCKWDGKVIFDSKWQFFLLILCSVDGFLWMAVVWSGTVDPYADATLFPYKRWECRNCLWVLIICHPFWGEAIFTQSISPLLINIISPKLVPLQVDHRWLKVWKWISEERWRPTVLQ